MLAALTVSASLALAMAGCATNDDPGVPAGGRPALAPTPAAPATNAAPATTTVSTTTVAP